MNNVKKLSLFLAIAITIFVLLKVTIFKTTEHGDCPGPSQQVKAEDVYMRGLIEQGSAVEFLPRWFECNSLQKNQYVLYRYSDKAVPVIKRVVAVEGDKFEVAKNVDLGGWELKVNQKIVRAFDEKPYFFASVDGTPNLKTYEIKYEGRLQKGHLILLSSFPPGDSDSGIFGVVQQSDLMGLIRN